MGYQVYEHEIEFYVADTGIGILPEKQQAIFQRFVKLNSFIHGTGLGLPICKSIVEQLNGRIGLQNRGKDPVSGLLCPLCKGIKSWKGKSETKGCEL